MNLNELNDKIEQNNFYKFLERHKKVINIIQGLFIIGLLIGMNIYIVQDYFIKKQIADNCGYVDSTYKCVCEKHYVEEWEKLQSGEMSLNLSKTKNVEMDW